MKSELINLAIPVKVEDGGQAHKPDLIRGGGRKESLPTVKTFFPDFSFL